MGIVDIVILIGSLLLVIEGAVKFVKPNFKIRRNQTIYCY